jgi:WD40 repeat protein
MERSRALIAAVTAIVIEILVIPAPAQTLNPANPNQQQISRIQGRLFADWTAELKDKDPAVRIRAVAVLGDIPPGRVGSRLGSLQDVIKGVMFGDPDRSVREAATASLLKLSRIPDARPLVDRRFGGGSPTVVRLVDTEGRPVAGAVVGTSFTRDRDRDRSFVPTEGTEFQTSDERGEAPLRLPVTLPMTSATVYAIRPDRDRPLVGLDRVGREQIGKQATIVMHPACRLRLRVECPGFRELEAKYHIEPIGSSWSRSAYIMGGDNVRVSCLLNTTSTTGELEFFLPPGRYTIFALGTETIQTSRSVEIPPGHGVKSLGTVELTPSLEFQTGHLRDLWRSLRAGPMDPPDDDAPENRFVFRRPRWGPEPRGGTDGTRDLAYSPDGNLLATAHGYKNDSGEVKFWDARTGDPAGTIPASNMDDVVNRLVFSPDGKTLATVVGSMNLWWPSSIVLWDVASHRELRAIGDRATSVTPLAFSPDSRILACGGSDKMARLWDVATGREAGRFEVDPERPQTIAYAPDGKTLAVAGGEVLKLWDVPGDRLRAMLEPGGFRVQSLAFSPDGKTLAAVGMTVGPQEGKVRLYDMNQEPPARLADLTLDRRGPAGLVVAGPRPFTHVAFTPDGRRLIAISMPTIAIWDVATGAELVSLDRSSYGAADRFDVSPDGRCLAVMQVNRVRIVEIPEPAR